jgi:hypothetical protein
VDSVDGLRPPALPAGPSTAEGRSIFIIMLDTIVPVSPGTNVCPEKSGAAQAQESLFLAASLKAISLRRTRGGSVQALERVRQVGPNKEGAKGSYTIHGIIGHIS